MISSNLSQGTNNRKFRHVARHLAGGLVPFLISFELMAMFLEYCVLNEGFFVVAQLIAVDHVVQSQLGDVVEIVGRHIEANRAVKEVTAKFEQRVQGQRGHVGLGPTVAAFLNILLKFDPSGRFLPFHFSLLIAKELFHLRKERMWFVRRVILVLSKNELNALGGGSDWPVLLSRFELMPPAMMAVVATASRMVVVMVPGAPPLLGDMDAHVYMPVTENFRIRQNRRLGLEDPRVFWGLQITALVVSVHRPGSSG